MNAEDTVMNIFEIDNIVGDERPCNKCPTPDGDCDDCIHIRIAKHQAEISFKMGYNQALKDIKAGLMPSDMV